MEDHQTTAELPAAEVKEELIDYQFIEVDSRDMHQLCTACLCATRTTQVLDDDSLKQYYTNILTEMQMEEDVKALLPPILCWECVIHLKKSVRFREQVQDSYRLLQPMLLTNDKEYLDELLQSPVCRPGRLQTCFALSVDIAPAGDNELPVMTADLNADIGMEKLLIPVKIEYDLNTEAEASDCSDTNIERRSSTPPETVATIVDSVKEDLDELPPMLNYRRHELLEETRTGTPVKKNIKTLNTARFQCEVCHKSYSNKSYMKRHLRTHTGEKPFQCEVCLTTFSDKWHLIEHIRLHAGEKDFQCQLCHKLFAKKSNFARHRKTHTGEKPFQCEVCRKSFAHKNFLLEHIRTHTGEKPYQCKVCQKSFAHQSNFFRHRKTHTGKKPFQCDTCLKSFAEKSHLIDHLRLHAGEKAFQCQVCHKLFAKKSNFARHRKTHTGEKPFQCYVCLRSFSEKSQLKRHLRTHTGEKPFQCKVCHKSLSDRSTLSRHSRTHAGATPFK